MRHWTIVGRIDDLKCQRRVSKSKHCALQKSVPLDVSSSIRPSRTVQRRTDSAIVLSDSAEQFCGLMMENHCKRVPGEEEKTKGGGGGTRVHARCSHSQIRGYM